MEKKLDCRGLVCPEPVARCRALLADKPEALQILVDNLAALENVGRFLARNGYATNSKQISTNEWRIDASATGAEQAPAESVSNDSAGKTLVLLTTETLGRGDDELGAKLMATFLATLPELGASLWRLILLNGAVKLSVREGETLKHLKALEDSGVSILVCGTCLMHYGLLEKKQVGETTNMMDVVTSMALAQKILRP